MHFDPLGEYKEFAHVNAKDILAPSEEFNHIKDLPAVDRALDQVGMIPAYYCKLVIKGRELKYKPKSPNCGCYVLYQQEKTELERENFSVFIQNQGITGSAKELLNTSRDAIYLACYVVYPNLGDMDPRVAQFLRK